ncbi:DUF4352 domain-containing protein [Kineosporia babensis]|uniref:DUF4352 domain-containing protein n=1 Tax=Kineosporia babensis TaxID=499548 RepID=A0A9X1N7J3_9ACTN|nr:DUF4352 domain-containing protein [Kineosporia babensis]MCD5309802.1 DUF4352 domain-containing protein [Kineosporia babensis]
MVSQLVGTAGGWRMSNQQQSGQWGPPQGAHDQQGAPQQWVPQQAPPVQGQWGPPQSPPAQGQWGPPQGPPQGQQYWGPPPKRRRRRGWLLAGAAVLVVIVGVSVANEPVEDDAGTASAAGNPSEAAVDKKAGADRKAEEGAKAGVEKVGGSGAADTSAPGIGDPVRDGKFEFTVTKVRKGVKKVGGEFLSVEAQGQFVLINITVENVGDEPRAFSSMAQTLYDAKDREFSADDTASLYLDDSNSFYTEINPGNQVKGVVAFDLPKGVAPARLELHDSLFSGGVDVELN